MDKLILCLCIFHSAVLLVLGDVSHLPGIQPAVDPRLASAEPLVTETCLGCMCEAMSECKRETTCQGDTCGLFRITWPYWADCGKPTVDNGPNTATDAYAKCANDPYCAAKCVQGYMSKYSQDCNGDQKIDCRDYMQIHMKGGFSCSGPLPPLQGNRFEQCLQQTGAI